MKLAPIDFAILFAYMALVLAVGFWLKRRIHSSDDFLMAARSLPAWVTGIAFMAANLGSLEVVGMIAMGAKYGMITNHWYWSGAIPGMVFLGLFMIRFYYSNQIRSVPEYLRVRFDHRSHWLNAVSFLVVTVLMSGINMYALALVCEQMLGWNFHASIFLAAVVVVVYTFHGGLASSIYNEVVQFFLIIVGFLPLALMGLSEVGWWDGLRANLPESAVHTWTVLRDPAANAMQVSWYGPVVALMLIMGPSYWCADFLLVQRALAAKDLRSAQLTPLIAAFPKMLFPLLVVAPGMVAAVVFPADALSGNYNLALPMLMERYYTEGLMGLGFTALIASFMSGMAGNVTAFNTVWTYDLYQSYVARQRSDKHYLWVARAATILGTALGIGAAYIVLLFDNLMDYMQAIGSIFIAPTFIIFFLGMFSKRITASGAFWGMVAGIGGCLGQYLLYQTGLLQYRSAMDATFHLAIWGALAGLIVSIVVSWFTTAKTDDELKGLVYGVGPAEEPTAQVHWIRRPRVVGALALSLCVILNLVFR